MNVDERHEDRRVQIIEATAELILADGVFSPSTEQIAKKGALNRTALNYYFDSKEELIHEVKQFALGLWKSKIEKLFLRDLSLQEHIDTFIDFSLDLTSQYPFLELFLGLEKGYNGLVEEAVSLSDFLVSSLCEELSNAMTEGKMHIMDPMYVIINLLSITDQPFRILSFKQANDDELRSFSEHFRKEKKQLVMRALFVHHSSLIA